MRLNMAHRATRCPRSRLLAEHQDPAMVRFFLIRGLTTPAIFLLSIGISFFSVGAAIWTWFSMVAIDAIIVRKGLPQ
jgi:TMEM175 potassium channel family protein